MNLKIIIIKLLSIINLLKVLIVYKDKNLIFTVSQIVLLDLKVSKLAKNLLL